MKTIAVIKHDPVPGLYLSFDASTDQYYLGTYANVKWVSAYAVFSSGTSAVLADVRSQKFEGFVYENGNEHPDDLKIQNQMATLLARDHYYHLVATFRVDPWHKTKWYVWQHTSAPVLGAR